MNAEDDSIDVETLDHEIDCDLGWASKKDKPRPRRTPAYWQAIVRSISPSSRIGQIFRRVFAAIGKVVFFPIFSPLSTRRAFDIDGNMTLTRRPLSWRIADGILMRLLLTPVILGLFLLTLVWLTTHPARVLAARSPMSMDLVYSEVDLRASDGQKLAAWYIPPMSADDVGFSGGRVVGQKWPGVVVAHGLGASHDSYLPLAKSLHTAGFAVLMLDTRGQGGSGSGTVTFGIREKLDILAGVKYLRELSAIDPTRICVVGGGSNAAAALHAAALDSSIAAVVADGLWPSFDARVKDIFDGPAVPTRWLAPLYTVTFEMALRERVADLNAATITRTLSRQPLLFLAYPRSETVQVEQVLALAEGTTAPHQVIVAEGTQEQGDPIVADRITAFLTDTTHWVSPRKRVQQEIQKLRESQVK